MTVLDPLVYEAAIKHWKHGHYRIAVGEAATNVDRFTQRRLQRFDVSGAPLMGEAFSAAPPQPGKPRLRWPGDQADDTVRSQQTGALNYAKACFMAMRNPAHHQKGDWNPLTAFHHVVSLSQVALWVRNWNLVSTSHQKQSMVNSPDSYGSFTLMPPTGRTAKQSCFLQCCRCQQRIPTCLRKGLVIQPADDAITPGFPVAVRRVIV